MTRQHWGVGALADASAGRDLGPEHPTRAGLVDIDVTLDDGVVMGAELTPGHLHRGAEKLFEVRDYRQVLMLADRHDWQAPFSGELGAALVCEHLWGLSAPPRAVVLRTLLAEVARLHSHLGFLSFVGHRHAQITSDSSLARQIRSCREQARTLMLHLSGNRLHPMLNRLGGLSTDAPPEWLESLGPWLDTVATAADRVIGTLTGQTFLAARGVGTVTEAQIRSFGVTGPAARASGMSVDLRRDPGYLSYQLVEFDDSADETFTRGDAVSRLGILAQELHQSVSLVHQCVALARTTPGPVNVKLAKIIKLPEGEVWTSIEAPWGMAGFHLVSRGDRTPWRLAMRTPTFANAQALQQALIGTPQSLVDVVIASLAWTTGDLDK